MKKQVLAMFLIAVLVLSLLAGCGAAPAGGAGAKPEAKTEANTDAKTDAKADAAAPAAESKGKIEVWSFLNQEEMNYYKTTYEKLRPNGAKVNVTCLPGDQYLTKTQAAFRSGANAPDVVYMEIAHLGQFKDTNMLESFNNAPYNGEEILANQIPYVVELSKNKKGEIKGISWQSTPGGFWFRRDLAKEYLGTDDPAKFQEMVKDWDTIVETGKKVYQASGGKVALLDDVGTCTTVLNGNAKGGPWVDEANGNKLISGDVIKNTMSIEKKIRDNNVDAKLAQWSAGWAAGMFNEKKFIVVGLPSWGLHYVIKANTPKEKHSEAAGMWGLVQAPQAYQAGGTWLSMYSKSKNKEGAWDYIKTLGYDEDYIIPYLIGEMGDFTSNIPAIEKTVAAGRKDPFLGDQNYYEGLYTAAKNVKSVPMTKYDAKCQDTFGAQATQMLEGKITVDQAAEAFRKDIKNAFPEVNIDE